jgi:hypothetical protein
MSLEQTKAFLFKFPLEESVVNFDRHFNYSVQCSRLNLLPNNLIFDIVLKPFVIGCKQGAFSPVEVGRDTKEVGGVVPSRGLLLEDRKFPFSNAGFVNIPKDHFEFSTKYLKVCEQHSGGGAIRIREISLKAILNPSICGTSQVTNNKHNLSLISRELVRVKVHIEKALIDKGLEPSTFSFKHFRRVDLGSLAANSFHSRSRCRSTRVRHVPFFIALSITSG